jgi:hypothetical protein
MMFFSRTLCSVEKVLIGVFGGAKGLVGRIKVANGEWRVGDQEGEKRMEKEKSLFFSILHSPFSILQSPLALRPKRKAPPLSREGFPS